MHTAVTASNMAAMRWAVAMRERAPASSAVPLCMLRIARPTMAPCTPAATSAASAPAAKRTAKPARPVRSAPRPRAAAKRPAKAAKRGKK